MPSLLSSAWLAPILGGIAFFATMAFSLLRSEVFHPAAPSAMTAEAASFSKIGPSWDYMNPEVDQLISELEKEKASLSTREQQLQELSQRLQAERAEFNQVTQSIHQLQIEFDKRVTRVKEEEVVNLKKMAKVYAAMSPEGAAMILKEMDDEGIIKILVFLKEDQSAPILEALAKERPAQLMPKRVALITDRLRLASAKPETGKAKAK